MPTTATITGNWFRVPDESVIGVWSFANATMYLMLPDGSRLQLAEDEWQGNPDLLNYVRIFGSILTFHQNSIRLTGNTAPGLYALGVVTLEQARAAQSIGGANRPRSLADAVTTSAQALIVLGVLGALMWFVPKDVIRSRIPSRRR